MAQLALTAETAFARIQGHAFSTGSTMARVADAVIAGQIQLPGARNTA